VRTSGLIYAAIALMWAAVLIPMWLRNHDSASESRSVERFGQAMRVLRRDQTRTRSADPHRAPAPSTATRPPAQRRRQPSLAQRRARTLGVLALLTGALTLLALATPLPWWSPLPALALLVAFVVHLRVQARQQSARRRARQRERAERHADAVVPERKTSGFVPGPSRAVVVETKGSERRVDEGGVDERVLDQPMETAADSSAVTEQTEDGEWRPNPLPLPTYVTAPKAVRPIKVIDLTTPGAWSSGRLIEDDLADEDLLAAEVADAELDALLEQEAAGREVEPPDAESAQRAVGD
jgi:hypothetical protein